MKKSIFAIIGSASKNSANLRLVHHIAALTEKKFDFIIFDELAGLPHFNPERSASDTPESVVAFREAIEKADGVMICTPEYIFSIPSGLKNAIEWCVATTVFSGKPVGLITASASGVKGHEELKLIMKTVETDFNEQTTLLIQGVKGKIDEQGVIRDDRTNKDIKAFIEAYEALAINKI